MSRRRSIAMIPLMLLAACGAGGTDEGNIVTATLHDDGIVLSQPGISSGPVSFRVENEGTMIHELEVFAGEDVSLPVANGVADTSGLVLIDEVEDIPPGSTMNLSVDLDPGNYVILCNLPGHYQAGMITELQVSG